MRILRLLRPVPEGQILVLVPASLYKGSDLAETHDYVEAPVSVSTFSKQMIHDTVMFYNCYRNTTTGELNTKTEVVGEREKMLMELESCLEPGIPEKVRTARLEGMFRTLSPQPEKGKL